MLNATKFPLMTMLSSKYASSSQLHHQEETRKHIFQLIHWKIVLVSDVNWSIVKLLMALLAFFPFNSKPLFLCHSFLFSKTFLGQGLKKNQKVESMLWHIIQHINEFSSVSNLKIKTQDIPLVSTKKTSMQFIKVKRNIPWKFHPSALKVFLLATPIVACFYPKFALQGYPYLQEHIGRTSLSNIKSFQTNKQMHSWKSSYSTTIKWEL